MPDSLAIQLLAAVTAAACAVPGVFLVLRRQALVSDAISHVVLLGIMLAFLATGDLRSPWLFAGAALTGVATVALVELLQRTRLVKQDAAIGLVFPALFSLGVILVSRHASSVHLDADAVLLGMIELAPLRSVEWDGYEFPHSLAVMAVVLALNVAFVAAFYKELKLATFDAGLALTLGFAPAVLHYALMTLVSLTAVAAFDAVGSVLVVALMIVPAITAYLLTDRLSVMLVLAVGFAAAGAVGGYWLARLLDANIAGAAATVLGVEFALAYLFAPERGLAAQVARRARQRADFLPTMLAVHLATHEGTPAEADESRRDGLTEHLLWPAERVRAATAAATRRGWVVEEAGYLRLTEDGRRRVRDVLP